MTFILYVLWVSVVETGTFPGQVETKDSQWKRILINPRGRR